ncbi:hypothetical protein FH972_013325 [Carpinus fangiana]|uniref:Transcription repressor n=1 Tax=Carpinus fangiana TaxID=176857 RepID=A0A5N6R9U5_9ROSI|nr:hypothetical protein FH972_013325 [Carpinus fangiana]
MESKSLQYYYPPSKFKKPKSSLCEASSILTGCLLPRTSSITTFDRNPPSGNDAIRGQAESSKEFLIESPRCRESPKNLHGTSRFFVQTGALRSLAEDARKSACEPGDIDNERGREAEDVQLRGNHRQPTSFSAEGVELPGAPLAVVMYTLEPHTEFRRSMMEMVGSRLERNLTVDWDYLEELVLCYLELNENKYRKYILSAFFQVLVELLG